jgi:hypothetical protein
MELNKLNKTSTGNPNSATTEEYTIKESLYFDYLLITDNANSEKPKSKASQLKNMKARLTCSSA